MSGGFNPTGTVTFKLFPPTDTTCTGTPVFTSPNSPLSGGSATSAPPFATTAVGTYHWVATYNGDANNTTVSSACADEPVTITQATPTIATTPSAGGPVGTSIFDTATVSGGVIPTGTVTFNLFGPGDANCTATPVFTSTVSLATRQIVVTSGSFTTAAAGTYHWVATYNGDANNAAVSSVLRGRAGCYRGGVVCGCHHRAFARRRSRRLHQRHGDGDRWLQPHRHGHLQPVPADGHDLRWDPGLHLHQPAERESAPRHLRAPVRDHHHGRLPLGRHLQR